MGRESLQVEDQTHRLGTMSCSRNMFATQGGPERWPAGRARRPAGDVAAWTSILPHPAQHSWGESLPTPPTPVSSRSSGTDYTAPGSRRLEQSESQ